MLANVKSKPLVFGVAQGSACLSDELLDFARQSATAFWAFQVKTEFNDPVDTLVVPPTIGRDWLPHQALANLGLKVADKHNDLLVMTTSVDNHVDNINGLMLALVVRNEGFYFSQRGHGKHQHQDGQWFVFNDAIDHAAQESRISPKEAVHVLWTFALKRT